jgi:hypothetical protein
MLRFIFCDGEDSFVFGAIAFLRFRLQVVQRGAKLSVYYSLKSFYLVSVAVSLVYVISRMTLQASHRYCEGFGIRWGVDIIKFSQLQINPPDIQ